jgi:hypothetical protein
LGFVLTVPAFFMGYLLDDHFLKQIALGGSIYPQRRAWDIFSFVTNQSDVAYFRERGILLSWWTPDTFRAHFFRPLASLVHTFQFRFLGEQPWAMHVFLAMIYALSIYLCARLLTKLCSSPVAAGVGVLLFAINDTHANSTGIIWGCNTVMCSAFGLGALLMHHRWRQTSSTTGLVLFCPAFVVALLCSEGGLALMGYLVAYALFREVGPLRRKVLSLVPAGLIASAYLLFYTIQQHGVKASGVYQSPTDDPWGSVFAVLYKTAMLVESQVFSLPPLNMALGLARTPGIIIGVLLVVGATVLFRKVLVANRTVAFFGTGMVLSMVPFALGPLQDRLLLWSGLGAAGMLGEMFAVPRCAFGKLQRGVARTLLFTNVAVSLVFYVPTLYIYQLLEKPSQALARAIPAQDTVMFSGPWDIFSWYPPAMVAEKGRAWPKHFYVFYTGPYAMTVRRTGERTFRATVEQGWFAAPETERYTRSGRLPFKAGDRVELELMTVTVEKVTSDGRPLSVLFTFHVNPSEFAWMQWAKDGPIPHQPPAIGTELRLVARLF